MLLNSFPSTGWDYFSPVFCWVALLGFPPLGGVAVSLLLRGVAFLSFLWVVVLFSYLPLGGAAWSPLGGVAFPISSQVVLPSPLGGTVFFTSSVGWRCLVSLLWVVLPFFLFFLVGLLFPCLLLGGAAWSTPLLGGVAFSNLFSGGPAFLPLLLVGLPLGGAAFFPFSVGWCCLVSFFFGWCCFSPLLCRGAAFLPLPLGLELLSPLVALLGFPPLGGVAVSLLLRDVAFLFLLWVVVHFSPLQLGGAAWSRKT